MKTKTGRPARIPATGSVFGKLTVVGASVLVSGRRRIWCSCACGTAALVKINGLLTGNNTSCGCAQKESVVTRNTTHGHAAREGRAPEYRSWAQLIARCTNCNLRSWKDYGGRGIRVCDRWRESFKAFLDDMGPRPSPKHSVERNDVNGNYEPSNCRWATDVEQANNTRRNRRFTHAGETLTLNEWAKRIGITASALHGRLTRMSVDRALSLPKQNSRWDQRQ